MPQFSIVMPTRNRARIVPWAIKSALAQEFDDFEVILSNNDSSDGTREAVSQIDDPRLRYVETDRTLPMPDSWEFAIGHARGDFVGVLCDDDALAPSCLPRLDRHLEASERAGNAIDMVYWPRFHYTFDDWHDEDRRNSLSLRPTTGKASLRETAPMLQEWFATCDYHVDAPMLLNGFVRRELVLRAQQEAGRFFIAPAPDVGASVAMLCHTDRMLHIDDVMGIVGMGRQSIGGDQIHRGASGVAREFEAEFRGDIFTRVPFKVNMIATTVTDTLAACKELLGDRLEGYEIDWEAFYAACYRELASRRANGWDTEAALEQLLGLMNESYPTLHERMREEETLHLRKLAKRRRKRRLRQLARSVGWTRKQQAHADRRTQLFGRDHGFSNILECAARLDDLAAPFRLD